MPFPQNQCSQIGARLSGLKSTLNWGWGEGREDKVQEFMSVPRIVTRVVVPGVPLWCTLDEKSIQLATIKQVIASRSAAYENQERAQFQDYHQLFFFFRLGHLAQTSGISAVNTRLLLHPVKRCKATEAKLRGGDSHEFSFSFLPLCNVRHALFICLR